MSNLAANQTYTVSVQDEDLLTITPPGSISITTAPPDSDLVKFSLAPKVETGVQWDLGSTVHPLLHPTEPFPRVSQFRLIRVQQLRLDLI